MPLLGRPKPSQTNTSQTAVTSLPPRKPLGCSNSGIDLTFTLKNGLPISPITLTTAFGKETFRGCQREVIEAALDDHDVFVLAPTGMGKSLCYQLPALAVNHGLTLVVSPLLALMQNQVSYLQSLKLPAATLNSTLPSAEREALYQDLNCGHPRTRLLYITPELASKAGFRKTLMKIYRNGELSRFVVDEGHCISEWGHDFRKDYRSLSYFRLDFPKVPIMVLTATATERVRVDVLKLLRLSPPRLKTFVMSFNRPNLHYEVHYKSANEDPYPHIREMIRQFKSQRQARLNREGNGESMRPVCGIIYSPRRALCDAISARLNSDGIIAAAYHAGLDAKDRERILNAWVDGNQIGVVVATVAFGMGVDRGDVRFIMHYELPKSIEAYYQESGRAGRDRRTARCILFYSREDVERTKYLITQAEARRDAEKVRASQRPAGMDNFEAMVNYCENITTCRHKVLCEYFGDSVDETQSRVDGRNTFCDFACDVCRDPDGTRKRKIEKLTPVGSQSEYFSRDEIERDVEMDMYDINLEKAPDRIDENDTADCMMIDEPETSTRTSPTNTNINTNSTKRSLELDVSKRPKKRQNRMNKGISDEQREETIQSLLRFLEPLNPPGTLPDILDRTAKRLEENLFNKLSNDRPVNTLGRSSTLLTAGRKQDISGKYVKEKEKLLEKVKTYVDTATKNDVELEQVQQGEIWDVIKDILDGN